MTLAASISNISLGPLLARGIFLLTLFIISACSPKQSPIFTLKGDIFGSYYLVKWTGDVDQIKLQNDINELFKGINDEFSNYQNDSVINRFNSLKAHQKMEVSKRFIQMLELCKKIHEESMGAFDPTLRPVIRLWGFGGGAKKVEKSPSDVDIKKALLSVGFKNISWNKETNQVWKLIDEVEFDTNSFVPGWAADLVGDLLKQNGIFNYMIDISGEFVVSGDKGNGLSWVVGIERPTLEKGKSIQLALKLRDLSIATSGNYRQFFTENGKRRSHIIDPRTGRPVEHSIASATVIAKSAFETDAWGTAYMVLGEEGLEIASQLGHRVLLLEAKGPGEFFEKTNGPMKEFLKSHQINL